MFAVPRPKKSILPPPTKKRKTTASIEEIPFNNDDRHEYLTGFHKRKQARIKHAQEEAAKKARQEKLDTRKQLREERRREAEEHVNNINKILRESESAGNVDAEATSEDSDAWEGFPDRPELEIVDHEEEYIDEDRYTTVTVESVTISRDGISKPGTETEEQEHVNLIGGPAANKVESTEHSWPQKRKKKQFRYESKVERQLEGRKTAARRAKRARH